MISFEAARSILESHCQALPTEHLPLLAAAGLVSSEDILAPVSLPLFRNSAMDGFALSSEATQNASAASPVRLHVMGEIVAGQAPTRLSKSEQTYRIMTGAPVPRGADAVLEKEKAVIEGDFLKISLPVPAGRHVRQPGEEIQKGALALPKHSLLHPGTIGFLASLGLDRVPVFAKPRVSVITTGSELECPGKSLEPGKIYNSNSAFLMSALMQMKITPILVRQVKDHPKLIRRVLGFALKESDIVIATGGVSAGEHDFVKMLLEEAGVETLFWKVSQKPGKPIYFGQKNGTLVFGLPGNPASVFTCFYEYVYPAIRLRMGHKQPYLAESGAFLAESLKADPGKSVFLKGRVSKHAAKPLAKQQSHMLSTLAETNALLVVNRVENLKEGDAVTAHWLPYEV